MTKNERCLLLCNKNYGTGGPSMFESLLEIIGEAFSLFIDDMIDRKKHRWIDGLAWAGIIIAIILLVYCLIRD